MGSLRFSIVGLMGLVALFAVDVAAFRSAQPMWVDACRFLTVSVLVIAAFLARGFRGEAGSFWFGFAVLGWAAFALVIDATAVDRGTPISILSRLPLDLYSAARGRPPIDWSHPYAPYPPSPTLLRLHIFQMMLVLPVGLSGGFACWSVERRRRRRAGNAA